VTELVYLGAADADLQAILEHLAEADPPRALRFVEEIRRRCRLLRIHPQLGPARDDLGPGMRTLSMRRRVVIAYCITGDTVEIVGVFYGGRNYEFILTSEPRR